MHTSSYQLYLNRGDRVTVPKTDLNVVRHHGIYWGCDGNGQSWFLHNHYSSGVQFITAEAFLQGASMHLLHVQPFVGNEWERQIAIARAESMVGRAYDLFSYNCEHYSNEVQYGNPESKQITNALSIAAGLALCVFGGVFAIK